MHGINRADGAFAARVEDQFTNGEHTVRVRIGKRPEQHRVDYAEDGRIGADTDGKGKNGDGAEAGIPANPSKGIAKILADGIERRKPALITIAFFGGFDAAEPDPGAAIGLVRRHTAPHIFFGEQLDMGIELCGEIGLGIITGEAPEQLIQNR